jgi:uncharacterized protein YbjQ (UPF0145 family)
MPSPPRQDRRDAESAPTERVRGRTPEPTDDGWVEDRSVAAGASHPTKHCRAVYRAATRNTGMEFVTTETVPDREIQESVGIARGNTVKARNAGRDITQSIRNITGGELKAYSELLSDAREEALARMKEDAKSMDADAVVNVRMESSEITNGGSEVIAYGTAVRVE